jgi:peroxiredoxin family protein
VFSDDLDKALASFVIANGAASTGKKVSMFFTFWGLNVIKNERETFGCQRYLWENVRHDASCSQW